jgi:NADH-quinone oxidoreductase subunit N
MGMMWLVIFAVAMSAVSLYYYLQVLKQIYVAQAPAGGDGRPAPLASRAMVAVVAAGVLLLGCAPDLLVKPLLAAIRSFGF